MIERNEKESKGPTEGQKVGRKESTGMEKREGSKGMMLLSFVF